MTVTYLDSGVLIAASSGDPPAIRRALPVLEDSDRTFVMSVFLRLELLPKTIYHRNRPDVAFDEDFFSRVSAWAEPIDHIVGVAERVAAQYGLNALDALHVAAAMALNADEFVTTEGPRKPVHLVQDVKVVAI